MPLLIPPSLIGISGDKNKNKHSVSFSYNWVGDVVLPQNIGGITFNGSNYVLNVAALAANVADLPAFRTLLLTETFYGQVTDFGWDGELLVSVSGVGQVMRFAQNQFEQATGTNVSVLTICVPIAANAPTKITFAKGENPSGVMSGLLTASIFDFDMMPFIASGTFNGN